MPEPSFLLDGMLGSLARWLRMMGYDSKYLRDEEDGALLAILGERYLLTRDKQLAQRAGPGGYYLESDDLDDQLSAVVERFGLRLDLEPTRCTACNGPLEKVPKAQVREKVEEGTWSEHQDFWMCRECGKVYWHGAHWKNIRDRLDKIS
jgi:hypothetical protein